ncbi:MAG: hypothetical protein JNK89_06460 [Saprospiraceae bacterium]|nr:hypothetical protein [Saprospiraceae bacterium]
MSAPHTIGRQVLQVQTDRFAHAAQLQQALSQAFWARMAPTLERVFDRHAGPGQWLQIDRLEIDLGPIEPAWLDQSKLETLLFEKAEAALLEALKNTRLETSPARTGPQRHFDLWLYWLLRGTLPWSAAAPAADWRADVLKILRAEPAAMARLRDVLRQYPQPLRRLVLQHEPAFLKSVLEFSSGQAQGAFAALVQEVKTALAGPRSGVDAAARRALEIWLWETALRETVVLQRPWAAEQFPRLLEAGSPLLAAVPALKKVVERKKSAFPALRALLEQGPPARVERPSGTEAEKPLKPDPAQRPSSPVQPELSQQTARPKASDPAETPPPPPFSEKSATTRPAPEAEQREVFPNPPENTRRSELPDAALAEAPGGYFVQQAGLVLLHPFLQRFFSKFELLDGPEFRDETARHRAVLLLQALAGGDIGSPDFNLVLPKFLCALPVNQPLDHTLTPTPEEREEADRLLQAAIDHWGALGATSPGGLREGFLQRPGKLEHTDTGWHLQVERRTLDILLDRLPWNLSLVKLPWMPELLRVDWH